MKPIEYLQSFAVIGLVLMGIGGFSYHLFKDDGWIEAMLGNVWGAALQYPLIVIPGIIASVFLFKMWNKSRLAQGRTSKLPDLIIYAIMAAGAVFLVRFFMYGNL